MWTLPSPSHRCRMRCRCSAPPGIDWPRTRFRASSTDTMGQAGKRAQRRTEAGCLASRKCGSWARFTTSPRRLHDAHEPVGTPGRPSRPSSRKAPTPDDPATNTPVANCRGLGPADRRRSTLKGRVAGKGCFDEHLADPNAALVAQPPSGAAITRSAARRDLVARDRQVECR